MSNRRSASRSSTLKKLTTRSNYSSRNSEKDITSKFGVGSVEHVEYIIKKRKAKKKKESFTRQNTRSSKNKSPFPKAQKRPSTNRSYSSPSTTRSSSRPSTGRVSGGSSSRRKR